MIDIALTFTRVDGGDGNLIVVPNEKVTTDVINHSAGNTHAPVTVDVWLSPDADLDSARKALEKGEVTSVALIEMTPEGRGCK